MKISSGHNEIFFISRDPPISRARGDYGKGTPASGWDHDMTWNKRLQIVSEGLITIQGSNSMQIKELGSKKVNKTANKAIRFVSVVK